MVTGPQLAAEASTGADALRAELVALHCASFAWALSLTARVREDAEDVLQASYAKVLCGDARFEGRASVKTWFFGVIRLTALEHRRRAWMTRLRSAILGEEVAPAVRAPELAAVSSERIRAVRDAMLALPRRQREVIHLVFYDDLSVAEAAAVIGVAIGSARQHYERGKARLVKGLAQKGILE